MGIEAGEEVLDEHFGQCDRQDSVFEAVVVEDIGKRGGDDGSNSEVFDGPDGVFPRGAASEISPGQQDRGLCVAREIQFEVRVGLSIFEESPIEEEELAETRSLDPFEKLFGNDLVGIDIGAVHGGRHAVEFGEWFHGLEILVSVLVDRSAVLPIANIDKFARDCGRCGHCRGDQVGASPFALSALEVSVGGRCAALSRIEPIRVHGQAHAATGLPPIETRFFENLIETLFFRLLFDQSAAGHDHRIDLSGDSVALDDFCRRAEVFDTGVGARSDKDALDGGVGESLAGFEAHIFQGTGRRLALGFVLEVLWRRDRCIDRDDLAGIGSPGDLWLDVLAAEQIDAVVLGAWIGGEIFPEFDGAIEFLGSKGPASQVVEGRLVRRDHTGAGTGLDRHVADGHAFFHREVSNHLPCVLQHISVSTRGGQLAYQIENQIFGRDSGCQLSIDSQFVGFGEILQKRLGRQDVFDFAGSDSEGQSAEGPVGCRVGITADDGHSRLGVPEFRTDDMDDSLVWIVEVIETDSELFAVVPERIDLLARDRIGDGQGSIGGWDVVIGSGDGALGATNLASGEPKTFKSLGAGHLVHKVQIDIKDSLFSSFVMDHVLVPDLLEHGPGTGWGRGSFAHGIRWGKGRQAVLASKRLLL